MRVVSLFCGIGQLDSGFENAGFEIVAAYDSWPKAVDVYNANLAPVAVVADLKQMSRADLPPHDLIIGGPPCQDHSLAGKRACKCHLGEEPTPRCCLRDFVRLATGSPYLMENVVSRLINAPWSERLNASNYGDVTTRKRWFYSNELLHIFPNPGPRRIRDIREAGADEMAVDRMAWLAKQNGKRWGLTPRGDGDFIGALGSGDWHGQQSAHSLVTMHKAGNHGHYDEGEHLGSLTAHAWHGHDVRNGKLIRIEGDGRNFGVVVRDDNEYLPSLRATSFHGPPYSLKLGLRGHSASASASAFEDDTHLGAFVSNSWHGNEAAKLEGCRNPTLLEMARAHSIPDSWDWCGATKTDRGKMIANGVPIGMATAVAVACKQALTNCEAAV